MFGRIQAFKGTIVGQVGASSTHPDGDSYTYIEFSDNEGDSLRLASVIIHNEFDCMLKPDVEGDFYFSRRNGGINVLTAVKLSDGTKKSKIANLYTSQSKLVIIVGFPLWPISLPFGVLMFFYSMYCKSREKTVLMKEGFSNFSAVNLSKGQTL